MFRFVFQVIVDMRQQFADESGVKITDWELTGPVLLRPVLLSGWQLLF